MKRALLAVLVVAALPAAAEGRREVGAHEHGHSVLNIAIEGDRVEIELISPGADIVGFEHAAGTDQQKAALDLAAAALGDPLALFVLPAAAGCVVEAAAVEIEAEEEHRDDDHAAEEHEAEEGGHNQFHVTAAIRCASPDDLGGITFAFFDRFPAAQEIDVTVITDSGQSRYEVTRDAPLVVLKGLI